MGVTRAVLNWYARLSPARGKAVPPYSHVVQIGDPVLRRMSHPVPADKITSDEVQAVISRLKQVMDMYGSVGLSAPQIGVNWRIFAMQVTKDQLNSTPPHFAKLRGMTEVPFKAFINPSLHVLDYTKVVLPEACESVRGFTADVGRFRKIEITGYNQKGKLETTTFKDWAARIAQHEMDHLEGRLYTDFMNRNTLSCTCWEEVNIAQGKLVIPFHPK